MKKLMMILEGILSLKNNSAENIALLEKEFSVAGFSNQNRIECRELNFRIRGY